MQPEDKALLDANVKRVVGVAALRRIRRLVNEWEEDDRCRAVFAKRVLFAIVAGTMLLTLLCLVLPRIVAGALRSLAGLIR